MPQTLLSSLPWLHHLSQDKTCKIKQFLFITLEWFIPCTSCKKGVKKKKKFIYRTHARCHIRMHHFNFFYLYYLYTLLYQNLSNMNNCKETSFQMKKTHWNRCIRLGVTKPQTDTHRHQHQTHNTPLFAPRFKMITEIHEAEPQADLMLVYDMYTY